jgi:16S rRNA (guanine(527)-N(7))-methyltransferase RsmG
MHPTRIAELLAPFLETRPANDRSGPALSEAKGPTANDQLYQNISTYIDILIRWNARINLTAIRDPEDIVPRHFGESLFAATHLFPTTAHGAADALARRAATPEPAPTPEPRAAAAPPVPAAEGRKILTVPADPKPNDRSEPALSEAKGPATNDAITVADIGSGAGFPGLPIKLWSPNIHLTLIESNQKKVAFLREVTRALTLTDVNVFPGRADDLPQATPPGPRPPFDLVTLRAVEDFTSILPTAASLVRPGGRLALLIGTPQAAQAQTILPTFNWHAAIPLPLSKSRVLLIAAAPPAP